MKTYNCWFPMILAVLFVPLATRLSSACAAWREGGNGDRGRISGAVVDAATGKPVAGAYVAIDHSGDAGGSNLERFKKEGIYATAATDEEGRFILQGVAFLENHPLLVTHPGFVRHQQTIALRKESPELQITVRLHKGATLVVTAVDGEGKPLPGETWMRLESKQGKVFAPLRDDWPVASIRMEKTKDGIFAFGELPAGAYAIDVIRFALPAITYHAGVAEIAVGAGETKKAELKPAENKSSVGIEIARDPYADAQLPGAILFITRNPGSLLWVSGKFYHPEDHRLGRIQFGALAQIPLAPDKPCQLVNFPPGRYALIAMTLGNYPKFKSRSVYLRGDRLEIAEDLGKKIAIPWRDPEGPVYSRPITLLALDQQVNLEAKRYALIELCDLLTRQTESLARFAADVPLQNETVALGPFTASIWDLLERLYLDKGWVVAGEDQLFTLRPGP